VEAQTGRVLWKMEESRGWIIATPLVHGDLLLFGASDGQRFYAVDRATGRERWSIPVQTRVFGSAVMVEGLAVFGGFNGVLRAVDPASGATRWTFQTPASREHFLRVHDADGELNPEMRELYRTGRGLEAENRILELGSIAGTPTRVGTTLYFGSTEGTVYALEVPPAGMRGGRKIAGRVPRPGRRFPLRPGRARPGPWWGAAEVLRNPATARKSERPGPRPASPRSRRCGGAPAPMPTSRHGRAPPGERRRCGGRGCPGRTGGSRS
jgi:hypothetical protein